MLRYGYGTTQMHADRLSQVQDFMLEYLFRECESALQPGHHH